MTSASGSTLESTNESSRNHQEIRPTPLCSMEKLEEVRLIVDGASGALVLCSLILIISIIAMSCENIPIDKETAEWLLDCLVLAAAPIGTGFLFLLPMQFVLAFSYVIRQNDERLWSDIPAKIVQTIQWMLSNKRRIMSHKGPALSSIRCFTLNAYVYCLQFLLLFYNGSLRDVFWNFHEHIS
ncbi:hypothetical protein PRIPAC_86504 [Pristionchus pacificus]|uniref:Uncharacterized protein n=1 Tax=Pristionchus pacificus TaxID=54126 RepID=A0A2A6BS18_PRIPA|nr:hypothetical protein PRIPAC_86504 [Pristionchus pacificus]|eukprot:PDM68593.1 hypothetical protein PRIPAC_46895 [Pristionchus pacificus]